MSITYNYKHPYYPAWTRIKYKGCTYEPWLNKDGLETFCKDMGEKPENSKLYKIDPNGKFEPSNCSWLKLGRTIHPLYLVYQDMINRCYNTNDPRYSTHGALGILVCDRWLDKIGLENFITDIKEKPDNMRFVRVNQTKNYELDNCKWITFGNRKDHQLYSTYSKMLDRCYNKKNNRYYCYGAREIEVCVHWLGVDGFDNFCQDMGKRPKNKTLDRIDVNKNYSPENCRWATNDEQAKNKRIKPNAQGYYGIGINGAGFQARINDKNKSIYLGTYQEPYEAFLAHLTARAILGYK